MATAGGVEAGQVSLSVLLALFTGDDYSEPCHSKELVVEICRRTNPTTVPQLLRWLYPWEREHCIPYEITNVVARGFLRWEILNAKKSS